MPTYEYKCPDCLIMKHVSHKISETPLYICQSCNKKFMERGPGGGYGVHFKGNGFYETDYKRKS